MAHKGLLALLCSENQKTWLRIALRGLCPFSFGLGHNLLSGTACEFCQMIKARGKSAHSSRCRANFNDKLGDFGFWHMSPYGIPALPPFSAQVRVQRICTTRSITSISTASTVKAIKPYR